MLFCKQKENIFALWYKNHSNKSVCQEQIDFEIKNIIVVFLVILPK